MGMEQLKVVQKAAHAAWAAAPSKATEAALSDATAAVAAAKRAAAPVVNKAALDAAIAAAQDRAAKNVASAALAKRVAAAHARYVRAHEWPQCGQGWGQTAQDRADMALIQAHGQDLCAWEDCA